MAIIRFSSREFPEEERKAALEEIYAPVAGMDIRSLSTDSNVEMCGRLLPGVALADINTSPHVASRTHAHIASGNDDLALLIPTAGRAMITQGRREQVICSLGEAYLAPQDIPLETLNDQPLSMLALTLPRTLLEPHLQRKDAVLMRKACLANREELRLLVQFCRMATREFADIGGAAASLSATYIRDLVALVLNVEPDLAEAARRRGLAYMRFQAVKQFVRENCQRADLSLETVATHHNISPHYVRKLFYEAGTSFSDFLVDARLGIVYRQLRDPALRRRRIGELVFGAGFNNLSWFNRAFKRRYGMTPSEVRGESVQLQL